MPDFKFFIDDSLDHADKINELQYKLDFEFDSKRQEYMKISKTTII